jgi:hypothetical protein
MAGFESLHVHVLGQGLLLYKMKGSSFLVG